MDKKFSILLCGAFGYGNFGDNLLRDTTVDLFKSTFPNIDIYVDRPYPNKELIDKVDLRIIGPGGLLYDGNIVHEEYYKKYAKKPYILFGTGFQFPFIRELKKDGLCEELTKNSDLIITRHFQDLIYINKYRENMSSVFVYPDIAFFSKIPNLYKTYISKKQNILFCPGQSFISLKKERKKFKNKIKKSGITQLISLSFYENTIIEYLRDALTENRTTNEYYFDSLYTVCSLINESDLFITGRFHGAVIAMLLGKKFVVLPKNNKNELEYKMKNLDAQIINWTKLKNNPIEYINSIPGINKIENILIEDIKNKKIDPMQPINKYMKDNFNIEGNIEC